MWQSVAGLLIAVDSAIEPKRAAAIRDALLARVVPIAGLVDGRPEPRGTGALLRYGREVWLVTAAHVLEGIAVGDLAVPSCPDSGAWIALSRCRTRVLAHPRGDVALISISGSAALRGWIAIDGRTLQSPVHRAVQHVIAGYPYAQMRRVDGVLYAKPVVVFTRAIAGSTYVYSRLAERVDGLTVHSPPLDGVSGALVWAIRSRGDRQSDCTLVPCGVQVAFRHNTHVRSEPIVLTHELLVRTIAH